MQLSIRHPWNVADRWPVWIHRYNWHRPHSSLKGKVPISRFGLSGNNLADLHI